MLSMLSSSNNLYNHFIIYLFFLQAASLKGYSCDENFIKDFLLSENKKKSVAVMIDDWA